MTKIILEVDESQSPPKATQTWRTKADQRLLLGASIRVLAHRFSCGKPILQDDVLRVASLADDAMEQAA